MSQKNHGFAAGWRGDGEITRQSARIQAKTGQKGATSYLVNMLKDKLFGQLVDIFRRLRIIGEKVPFFAL